MEVVENWRTEGKAMTFDEASMERSKSFVKALQELKNLKPQLYSAAEYCEKSYLHNEQKQVVLDNLKDYAVRALVNAVDHLGTVAYKLTDLVEMQKSDISTVELKISCLNQRIVTCQTYMDKESLWQQKLPAATRRHHKHYVLPNAVNKKVRINPQPQIYTDGSQNSSLRRSTHPKGVSASKTLSWHLASESKSTSDEAPESQTSIYRTTSIPEVVSLRDAVEATPSVPLAAHLQSTSDEHRLHPLTSSSGAKVEPVEFQTAISSFKSLGTPVRQEIIRSSPIRSKSVFSALFAKNKLIKQKRAYVS